jgi:UDP-glucose 4-epimerase
VVATNAILVAGGAGYIGSHFCHVARQRGFSPIVVDRIGPSTEPVAAYRRAIGRQFPLEICDIADEEQVDRLIARHTPVAAVCFAALIEVAESVAEPDRYWDNNYVRPMRFFRAMTRGGVRHLVFSSTAAVYDARAGFHALPETHQLAPASPYGLAKLACELMLQGSSPSHRVASDVRFVNQHPDFPAPRLSGAAPADFVPPSNLILRYFNAAGADPAAGLGEVHEPESHLIPNALAAVLGSTRAGASPALTINGVDYPTDDGTCVRDYVHVLDLADAHVAALEYLLAGGASDVVNLGSGSGYSIRQVVETIESVSGVPVGTRLGPRRAGDPARLVADVAKAQRVLGWQPRRTLRDIVASALEFHRHHHLPIIR